MQAGPAAIASNAKALQAGVFLGTLDVGQPLPQVFLKGTTGPPHTLV